MNANGSDDRVLRRYLLGTLSPDVRDDVEKRLFSDDRIFWERLCLVEDELIDEYVENRLDSDETTHFEGFFLSTDERRTKLDLARELHAYAATHPQTRKGWVERLQEKVSVPAWAVASAAASIVVTLGIAATVGQPAADGTDVAAWLTPGLVREVGGQVARVELTPGCSLVRLLLERENGEATASYRATLHDVSGNELWSQNGLRPAAIDGREAVIVTLPCETLSAGDYSIRLWTSVPNQEPGLVDRYDVRVLRP